MSTTTARPRSGSDLLGELRADLLREREFRIEQLAELTAAGGPGGAAAEVRDAVVDGAVRALADIDAALAAMRAGRYGRCRGCDGSIPWQVLRAIPRTRFCLTCQAAGPPRRF